MSPSQKGFLPMEGCLEHNHLISSVLQDSRMRKRPIILTWLDLKDAYGSVPHQTLFSVLDLAGLRLDDRRSEGHIPPLSAQGKRRQNQSLSSGGLSRGVL